ncbi:MAG: HAD family hydrolase [Gammaproteobacteria bacterium]|nr:MAG: HAD family hydrolase [Gammaproteobacteria bacterium]
MICCITFDLDDTLWACAPVIERAERASFDWLTEHYPRIAQRYGLQTLLQRRQGFFLRHPDLHHDITRLRKKWLAALGEEFDYGSELVEPAFQVFWRERNRVELFEDVRDTLDTLQGRYRLGAITNGNADVHYIGIGHYFDFVITAAGAGAGKPDKAIFEAALKAALKAANAEAQDVVHVGDDPKRDIAGAQAAGLKTIWVNAGGTDWVDEKAPDGEIRALKELPTLLSRWSGDASA